MLPTQKNFCSAVVNKTYHLQDLNLDVREI